MVIAVFALGVKKTGSWDPIGLKKRGPQNKNGSQRDSTPINMMACFFKCMLYNFIKVCTVYVCMYACMYVIKYYMCDIM